MIKMMLFMLAVASSCFAVPYQECLLEKEGASKNGPIIDKLISIVNARNTYPSSMSLNEIRGMLEKESPSLSPAVIDKVLTTLTCLMETSLEHNNILTVIDYSKPSNEKRLWVFDLKEKQLLFYTYVSHGIKSGALLTRFFSNKHDSKASSIGVYKTEKPYYGRDGLSLRLDGLDASFNDNASSRSVVMHGGWYVDESFIKKYGRAGRSWGCPALPQELTKPIINTIKDSTLFVVYYPSDEWFSKSKFLNCGHFYPTKMVDKLMTSMASSAVSNEPREGILFADLNQNNRRDDSDPVAVVTADDYARVFHATAPLERMLRRQINHVEYVALSPSEFQSMIMSNVGDVTLGQDEKPRLTMIVFVIPVIKMVRGYYETQMHLVPLGKIKEVKSNQSDYIVPQKSMHYTVSFENKSVTLRTTDQFIRWVGL